MCESGLIMILKLPSSLKELPPWEHKLMFAASWLLGKNFLNCLKNVYIFF